MGRATKVSWAHRRALNQAMIHARHAPAKGLQSPGILLRALRSALGMSQANLARRSQVEQAHIARLENGLVDARFDTLRRLLDAMFCDLLILPRPRQRLGDVIFERDRNRPSWRGRWED